MTNVRKAKSMGFDINRIPEEDEDAIDPYDEEPESVHNNSLDEDENNSDVEARVLNNGRRRARPSSLVLTTQTMAKTSNRARSMYNLNLATAEGSPGSTRTPSPDADSSSVAATPANARSPVKRKKSNVTLKALSSLLTLQNNLDSPSKEERKKSKRKRKEEEKRRLEEELQQQRLREKEEEEEDENDSEMGMEHEPEDHNAGEESAVQNGREMECDLCRGGRFESLVC